MSDTQSAANHAKLVTGYHKVAFPLLALPMFFFIYRAATAFSVDSLALALFSMGAVIGVLYGRIFPLGVQDRVIRMEERMRMERLLPDDLKGRINDVSTEHLIGLRFASDAELADLTRRVLAGEMADRKAVKNAIKNWRADHQRI